MSRKRMWQIVFAVYALIGVLALLAYLLSLPIGRQIEWHQRIRADLKKLARLKPTDANSGQWDYAVGWTSNLDANCFEVDSYDDFKKKLEEPGGFLLAHWDGTRETEDRIAADTKATIRCIPDQFPKEPGKCILTGEPSAGRVVFAKAY